MLRVSTNKRAELLDDDDDVLHRSMSTGLEYIISMWKLFGILFFHTGRRGGLRVSVLVPGASSLGLSPGQGHCVVFLGKTLNSHSGSLYPGV